MSNETRKGDSPSEVREEVKESSRRPANMVTSWGPGLVKRLGMGAVQGGNKTSKSTKPVKKETPKRAALRAAVASSVERVRNSPRVEMPQVKRFKIDSHF